MIGNVDQPSIPINASLTGALIIAEPNHNTTLNKIYIIMPNAKLCLGLKSTFLCKTKLITLHINTATIVTKNGPHTSFMPNRSNVVLPFIFKLFIGSDNAGTFSHTNSIIICTRNPAMLKTIKITSCKKPFNPFFFFGASGSLSASLFLTARSWS